MDPVTKAAKKNQKRKEKKREGRTGYTSCEDLPMMPDNMIAELRVREGIACDKLDHYKATEIRRQIRVLMNMSNGMKTEIRNEELADMFDNIPKYEGIAERLRQGHVQEEPDPSTISLSESEKELKKLRKKIDQISKLKERRDQGEKLEVNQLEKIRQEPKIEEAMQKIEEGLSCVSMMNT